MQYVLQVAFAAVLERHLEQVATADLALWSLRGMEVLEPGFSLELREGTLLLSASDRLLAARPLPPSPPETPAVIAAIPVAVALAAVFEAAWHASPALRRAGVERLLQTAFEELFNHLDPYSRYLAPEDARGARARRVGQNGLGLRLAAGPGRRVVVAIVTPGAPAAEAGLLVGDRLLAVDGFRVSADDLPGAAAALEGPADSGLGLLVQRGRRRFELRLLRRLVTPDSVQATLRDGILWLRIEGFAAATDRKLADALAVGLGGEVVPRGVVIDLRGNRGGLLSQAVAIASSFLTNGPVARTAGRHPDAARDYAASGPDRAGGLPLVVLVDGRSASAAEIVAAALADRGRAVVVGSATMGKGLIQAVIPLPNGGELLVTWSRVLAPRGWPIQGLGVLPALCTSLGAEATAAALVQLRQGALPMAAWLAAARSIGPDAGSAEISRLRASCPPAEGRETDIGSARALIEDPLAYRAALQP